MCGKLFCSQGQPDPNYGRMVSLGVCKAAFFDDPTKDFGQVEAGTRCGEGKVGAGEPRPRHAPELTRVCVCVCEKVCSQNECVELQTAYRNTNCSHKCSGHAVSPEKPEPEPKRSTGANGCVFAQVCNHKNQCQCEPGWAPPDCTSKHGSVDRLTSKT